MLLKLSKPKPSQKYRAKLPDRYMETCAKIKKAMKEREERLYNGK